MSLQMFISNAPEDQHLGASLAALIARHGHQAWRHEAPLKSAAYRARTLEVLNASQLVIVIWSAAASVSPWVIDEADAGMKTGPTVGVQIGGATSPLGFAGAVNVKARLSGNGFSEQDETDVWEAVLEAADAGNLLEQQRRLWLDRSLFAAAISFLVDLVVFGALAFVVGIFGWLAFFQGSKGFLLGACFALGAAVLSYAGDASCQVLGTPARAFRRRLRWRWAAGSLGAGIGALLGAYLLHGYLQLKDPNTEPHWWANALQLFLLGGTLVAGLMLTFKFVPLFMSRRLRLALLARPG